MTMKSKSTIFVVASIGVYLALWKERLWPWGLAESLPWEDRPKYAPIDPGNNSLKSKGMCCAGEMSLAINCVHTYGCPHHTCSSLVCVIDADGKFRRIYERVGEGKEPLLKGPETVVFDNDGGMYILSEEGFLVEIKVDDGDNGGMNVLADTRVIANLGPGRPLGGKFDAENTLYLADAHLGLTRLRNPRSKHAKVELVASQVLDQGQQTQILYANDVAIGPKSGNVYFTDCKYDCFDLPRKANLASFLPLSRWTICSNRDCSRSHWDSLLRYDVHGKD
jgi:hypothetical protein